MYKLNHRHIFKIYNWLFLRKDEILLNEEDVLWKKRNIVHHCPLVATCNNVFERV